MKRVVPTIKIDWEAVEEARDCPPGRKSALGGELFVGVCERMSQGIRNQFPDISEEAVERELARRLELSKALELRL